MKNTQKHTPGPWTIENCKNDDGSKFLSINGQGPWGSWLADIQAGNINGKPADIGPLHLANAHLIAAAPDLLEVLIALDKAGGIWPDLYPAVQAAIAKAEGNA
jgi:hypothetical protein